MKTEKKYAILHYTWCEWGNRMESWRPHPPAYSYLLFPLKKQLLYSHRRLFIIDGVIWYTLPIKIPSFNQEGLIR